jgi:hypothetical protein
VICVKKIKKIERFVSHIKHSFPLGTEFIFEYENSKDEISPEELRIREKILSNGKEKQKIRQSAKKGLVPVGRTSKPFTINVYRVDGSSEKMYFKNRKEFYKITKAGLLEQIMERKTAIYYQKSNTESIFNFGDVLIYNEDIFDFENYKHDKIQYTPFLTKIMMPCGKNEEILCYSNKDFVVKIGLNMDIITSIRKNGKHLISKVLPNSRHHYPKNTIITIRDINPLELIKYYQENKK